ncbi:MAG: hypothetical protein U9Q82_05805 [Chloroflexota bacterium]|nr:hypothetical protein [Chloroflexota bacterium]
MTKSLSLLLLVLVIAIAWYDQRFRRVPNAVNYLLILAGGILHFPGTAEIWLGCLVLMIGWRIGGIGGGDAKLWMALLWLAPIDAGSAALITMCISFALTAIAQMLLRKLRSEPVMGISSPGAWRSIPYVFWMVYVSF